MESTIRTKSERFPGLGERFGPPSVWFAFLGGPVIWAAQFLTSYGLVYAPCAVRLPLLILVTIVAALVAITAGVVSWRLPQQSPATETDAPAGRNRFVGIGGLLNSVLFLLIILVQGVIPLVLDQCR